ncbi:MAG TPA: choice-of-anchor Q domain-containing protein, partial [Chthoniobacterales bacterium]
NAVGGNRSILFRQNLSGTIQLASALPNISTNISILGPGKDSITVRRNTGGNYRIFTITNATATGPVVTISGLTITNGRAPFAAFPSNSGGGIFNNRGTLTLSDCALLSNASDSSSGGWGGGLLNLGASAIVDRCTFADNTAENGGAATNLRNPVNNSQGTLWIRNSTISGNQAINGGGIYNVSESDGVELRLINSTVSGNTATGLGGGVYSRGVNGSGVATVFLNDCTFNGNSAASDGGGLYNSIASGGSAQAYLKSNIFKTGGNGPNVTNVGGSVTSTGYNLTNDQSGFTSATGDIRNTDPMLGPLASNGGPTQTHALLAGSMAIDHGDAFVLSPLDQRGFFHVGTNDIGSYEYNGIELRIISITRNGNNVIVKFNAAAQRTFRLERKTDVSLGTWQSIPGVSDLTPSANGAATITDPGAIPLGHAFYRVRYIPPF